MKALNLGCGRRVHPAWTNVDVVSGPNVLACDLNRGIPFPDKEFDVVYLSHLLEHFSRSNGQALLQDCFRVCRSGGFIRVVVPDLERIAQLYLEGLRGALSGDVRCMQNYNWMMLELYDQTVREKSGGGMIDYLRQNPLPNESFVIERIGDEARGLLKEIRAGQAPYPEARRDASLAFRSKHILQRCRTFFLRLLLGQKDYDAMLAGRFRRGGEVHQWMYDRFSLAQALDTAGFRQTLVMTAMESRIPGWAEFRLDSDEDGAPYKPDSLYMEAAKP